MTALGDIYFYACALACLAGALGVVVSKNPIRSAMGLLLLILSVAGLFLALHAEFLAFIQLIVYAGAIVILFLFVIMLLGPSASTPTDRRGVTVRIFGGGLFGLAGLGAIWTATTAMMAAHHPMAMPPVDASFGGIDAFGSVLFADALVPFELSSALLMVAVVGAIAVAKGRQGAATMSREEAEVPEPEVSLSARAAAGNVGRLQPRDRRASLERREGTSVMIPAEQYVILSSLLFVIGGVGFLIRRNVLVQLMSIEVMLNAANLALVAFNRSRLWHQVGQTYPGESHTGQVFAFFIIAAEAAEVAVGLAIVLALYRLRRTVRSDEADLLKN